MANLQASLAKTPMYQVVDEQNHPVYETESFFNALREADLLNYSFDDHYFFVEVAEAQTH